MGAPTRRPLAAHFCKVGLAGTLFFGGMALIAVVSSAVFREFGGPPFRMVIEPDGDHAVVQFTQPGSNVVSKSFPIDVRFDKREEVVLDSRTATIPKGQIEFADTTLRPGRFKIRLGQTLFDVMPRGIDVNGEHFDWLSGDAERTR